MYSELNEKLEETNGIRKKELKNILKTNFESQEKAWNMLSYVIKSVINESE